MKVLILSHSYPSERYQGTTPFIRYFSESLAILPDTEVVTLLPHQAGMNIRRGKLETFSLSKSNRIPHKRMGGSHKVVNLFSQLSYFARAFIATFQTTRKEKVDLIHAHWALPSGIIALAVSKLTGIPYTVTTHGRDVINAPEYGYAVSSSPFFSLLMYMVFRSASRVIVTSPTTESATRALCSKAGTVQIPVGFDSDWLDEIVEEDAKDGIIFLGDLIPRKGVDQLLEAISMSSLLRSVPVFIVGDGSERDSLVTQAESYGLSNVSWPGRRTRKEIMASFTRTKVLVMPSYVEGFGIVLLEALASGLAIVATSTGIAPELAQDEVFSKRIRIIPQNDPALFAKSLEESLALLPFTDDDEMREMLATKYSWKVIANSYRNCFEEVLLSEKC